ncbi:anti-sigma factor [Nocardioides sp. CBS4Y-1]|uniref:Anti-sigma factor n=1 Tax=Nocardioides acrostichi TaxID=2784339 RepID=A0A930UXI3_9ACTN|nr:anti-sigma factor [Nocardioides acrostichi]
MRLPAERAYVSVLRTLTAGLAARLDFTIDDIEDLRIVVGEACAIVLSEATAGGDLLGRFTLGQRELGVDVSVPATEGHALDEDSFAWQVLTTLAGDVAASTTEGRLHLRMVVRASALDAPAGP